jgi:hypothetical protein
MDYQGPEARIKALTTLIRILRPQNGTPTPGSAESRSANAQAYHHVATLLTRGVEDGAGRSVIAVTGANAASGAVVTVVSSDLAHITSLSNPERLPSSPILNPDPATVHMAVTQNWSAKNSQNATSQTFSWTRVP